MAEALKQVVELFRAKDWKFEVDEENDQHRTIRNLQENPAFTIRGGAMNARPSDVCAERAARPAGIRQFLPGIVNSTQSERSAMESSITFVHFHVLPA